VLGMRFGVWGMGFEGLRESEKRRIREEENQEKRESETKRIRD